MDVKIGVIGGSGLYQIESLKQLQELKIPTPYGEPSDVIFAGELAGVPIVFLPRHGRGHRFMPTDVPYRANIYAFKKIGVTHVISVSACGSLKEKVKPGEFVIVDQFLDRTRHRADTFFTGGIVAHVAFADPVCPTLARLIYDTATELNIPAHWAGTYVCMEGPQFSTRAESLLYRSWGMDVIGMTNYTEARLAREAEMHYATMAMVTDYDCWRSHDADVDIIDILRVMRENAEHAKQIIAATVGKIQHPEDACTCAGALEHAIITHRELIPAAKIKELGPLVEKYLK